MNNDTGIPAQQAIPGEMLNYWQSKSYDALCRFDEKPIAENMLFEKGYIEGRKDQYLHSQPPSPALADGVMAVLGHFEYDREKGTSTYVLHENISPSPVGEAGKGILPICRGIF